MRFGRLLYSFQTTLKVFRYILFMLFEENFLQQVSFFNFLLSVSTVIM